MFRGINAVSIDTKGRVTIPTKYRDALSNSQSDQVIITMDTDAPCLLVYPLYEWEIIERKISELPSFNAMARRIQRVLIGHATEVELDGNGRLLVPPVLRGYAGLEKNAMVVGQGKKLEIWSDERWDNARQDWLASDLISADEMPAELKSLSL